MLRTIRTGRGAARTAAVLSAAAAVGGGGGATTAQAAPARPAAVAAAPFPAATTGIAATPIGSPRDDAPTTAGQRAPVPAGSRVVTVRFKPGTRTAAVAGAVPLAAGARAARVASRSVAPRTNAATYTVDATDADGFLAGLRARSDVADARYETFAHYDALPNDPLFRTASTTDRDQFPYLASVSIGPGWDLRGSNPVKIAIIDSGMDVGHPDLASKVDPADRWNTFSQTANVTDTMGHGTFVAGIAGAATGNGIGIAGVGWDARLMAVKVADPSGGLALTDIAEGIVWAVDHGAKVLNISLGSTTGSPALASAVAYAQAQGAVVVASAGNAAQEGNPVIYPAAYPGVIAVGATDGGRFRAWFSEHGPWVTMAAPGVRIVSTTVRAGSTFWPAGSYNIGNGTSFAAPIVAGTAALVWSRSADATGAQVRAAVVKSGGASFKGFGLGSGEVNVGQAMGLLPPAVAPTIVSPSPGQSVSSLFILESTTNVPAARTHYYIDGEPVHGFTQDGSALVADTREWPPGPHTIEARNCSSTDVCPSTPGPSVDVTFADSPAQIDTPADGDTVSGEITITTSGSPGPVAIYEGTTRLALESSPFGTRVNLTGHDGTHHLEAVLCDTAGTRCDGARSAVTTIVSASADVTAGPVTQPVFTPNGDGVRDTTSMDYTTAGTQHVTVSVVRAADQAPVRTFPGQDLPAGTRTVTWDGRDDAGLAVDDGRYTIRVDTVDAGGRAGLVTGSTVIDVTRPTFAFSALPATAFYPVVDGYQDTFRPQVLASEASVLTFVVRNAAGTVRRTLTKSVAGAGTTSLTWDGKDDAGRALPSGAYSWTVRATDPAGLTFSSRARDITLSPQRLTTRYKTVTYSGGAAWGVNSGPACAKVTATGSSYASGVWLKNTCAKGSTGTSALHFRTRVPGAKKYLAWRLKTTGRSHSAPVDVYGGLMNGFTNTYDISGPDVRVPSGATTTRTLDLGRVSEAGSRGTTFDVAVFVQNWRLAPLTDWDLKSVSVTVAYQVLA